MGLFNVFKKKELSHEEKVEAAYKCYKPEAVEMVFPGGKRQAEKIIMSLAKVYGVNLEYSDSKTYYSILTTYTDVLIRRILTQSSNKHIITSLMEKHSDLIKSKDAAMKALTFITMNMNNNDFSLETDNDVSLLEDMEGMISALEEKAEGNTEAVKENLDDPEYGLVPNKPIYTNGVDSSYIYLDSLRTSSGEVLTWNRLGSQIVEGVDDIIDVYESTLPSGEHYKTLYVDMYGPTNSKKAPQGFKFWNQ